MELEAQTFKNLIQKKTFKEKTQESSLNTSKNSYIDTRLIVSWCKDKGVPLEKVLSKALLQKSVWAMSVDSNWWKTYPRIS